MNTLRIQEEQRQERCLGEVRWAPLSMMQAHERKLQQLWEVLTIKGQRVIHRNEEWRDVPFYTEELVEHMLKKQK